MNIKNKIMKVITSCKTIKQLVTASIYVDLAEGRGLIDDYSSIYYGGIIIGMMALLDKDSD